MKVTIDIPDAILISTLMSGVGKSLDSYIQYLLEREIHDGGLEYYGRIYELVNKFNKNEEGYIGIDEDYLPNTLECLKEVLDCYRESSIIEKIDKVFWNLPSVAPTIDGLKNYLKEREEEREAGKPNKQPKKPTWKISSKKKSE